MVTTSATAGETRSPATAKSYSVSRAPHFSRHFTHWVNDVTVRNDLGVQSDRTVRNDMAVPYNGIANGVTSQPVCRHRHWAVGVAAGQHYVSQVTDADEEAFHSACCAAPANPLLVTAFLLLCPLLCYAVKQSPFCFNSFWLLGPIVHAVSPYP